MATFYCGGIGNPAVVTPQVETVAVHPTPPASLTFYPFAYALLDDELSNYCWYCLKENDSNRMSRCSACHMALFCDKNCQLLGWSDHKAECRGLSSGMLPGVEVRMLGRLVWRHKQIVTGRDKKVDSFYANRWSRRQLMELCHHEEEMRHDPYAMDKFNAVYQKLVSFYDAKFLMDQETVFQIHCRNYINRHAISDRSYLKEVAKGLYLDLCAYNHSCRPNCFYLCKGIVAELRKLEPDVDLNNTETTFYTYIDLLNSKQERRKLLNDTWYFRCECTRCVDQLEHVLTGVRCEQCKQSLAIFEGDDTLLEPARCTHCHKECSKERAFEAIDMMKNIEELLGSCFFRNLNRSDSLLSVRHVKSQASDLLSPVNISYIHLLQAEINNTDLADVQDILASHLAAVDCMRLCYPRNHPVLAYHLMNIGIFYCQLKKSTEARDYLKEAYEKMCFTLFPDHGMTQHCMKWLKTVEEA